MDNNMGLPVKGVTAPKNPEIRGKGFYLMLDKQIAGFVQPDGKGIQFLYLDGRIESHARIVGNITDERILGLLKTAKGFRELVDSIGVVVEITEGDSEAIDFVLQMYGKGEAYSGTKIRQSIPTDGMERIIRLADYEWSEADETPGQIRFEFPHAGEQAIVSVKLYLRDGFDVPEDREDENVNLESADYGKLLARSLLHMGNPARLQKAIDRARRGETVTIAFIGGSITQGAGAIPIHTECYAYKTFQGFCRLAGKGTEENVHYIKAGVGGTPSELGMLRYERDVLRGGSVEPDIVVVEFAVNDEGDETKGECYDSLVRKILSAGNSPAVILLFAVFSDDWNLQERLDPVGMAYDLPMVSIKDAVTEQFYARPDAGRVFSKRQFFYDCFHPTSLGHSVMADCILNLFRAADTMQRMADMLRLDEIEPPLGGEFETVRMIDRESAEKDIHIDCGSFFHRDEELQAVEMDCNLSPVKEFPYNWMHRADAGNETPFSMEITCSALLLIYKDSGSGAVGRAEVLVDGEKVFTADPHVNGWIHCNAAICFRGWKNRRYHVEVRMAPGDEEKEFTILGFGYVG